MNITYIAEDKETGKHTAVTFNKDFTFTDKDGKVFDDLSIKVSILDGPFMWLCPRNNNNHIVGEV